MVGDANPLRSFSGISGMDCRRKNRGFAVDIPYVCLFGGLQEWIVEERTEGLAVDIPYVCLSGDFRNGL